MEDGETAAAVTGVQAVQFSDEYRKDISNEGLVSFVTENGRIIADNDKVFTKLKGRKNNRRNITFILIVTAIILLILDIIARRFGIQEKLAGLMKKIRPVNSGRIDKKNKRRKAAGKNTSQPDMDNTDNPTETISSDEGWADAGSSDVGYMTDYSGSKTAEKKEDNAPAALDTAALLKKKKDRNL